MAAAITTTELRKNIYKLLDHVLETGNPVEILRKGKRLMICPLEPRSKLERLEPHPNCLVDGPEKYVQIDWSEQWNPDL